MNNSFAAQHPELIYEWSEKNLPLTPDRVSYGSNKRVWWRAACGHELLAENSSDSARQIQRYIRLTHLIPEILELVDNAVLKEKDLLQIALRPAVELSYLTEKEQQDLMEIMDSEDCTPSHAQAIKMRQFSQEGRLNYGADAENPRGVFKGENPGH